MRIAKDLHVRMWRTRLSRRAGALFASLIMAGVAYAQAAAPSPLRFDVVSIKQNRSGMGRGMLEIAPEGDRVVVTNSPMYRIIAFAYDRQRSDLIVGVPDWAKEERWDIEAKVASDDLPAFHALSFTQQKAMLQSVLGERCKLQIHSAKKEVPVYALITAKGGSKMHEDRRSDSTDASPGWNLVQKAGEAHGRAVPLAALLFVLSGDSLNRQVIDRTGLAGLYDFDLLWTPQSEEDAHAASSAADQGLSSAVKPSLFIALPEQLGLRLDPIRAQVDALLIDHIEQPTSN